MNSAYHSHYGRRAKNGNLIGEYLRNEANQNITIVNRHSAYGMLENR